VPSLKRALQLARLHGGELFVVHVAEQRFASIEAARRSITNAFLTLRQHTDREPLTAPVRWIVAYGNPAIEVARFIRRMNADLAVVGAALPGPSTVGVGTVAHAVLRIAACPVLVIPRAIDDTTPKPYGKILCGVSSGRSTETLRYALSLAQEFESRLTILNVEVDNIPGNGDAFVNHDIDALRTGIPDGAHDWCVIDELVTSGEPAQEVVKATQKLGADLVVVGSTGAQESEGGLGAVALGTLMLTDVELLAVPAPGTAREITMAA
jgi:nucleotide-binding universal stress UspA family protein